MMNQQQQLKTLYLDGHDYLRVLQDGPALRVRQRMASDRLYPLRLLAQVVVKGPADWSTNALLACAEATVPVIFLHADGSLRGRVLGIPAIDPLLDLNLALETFLDLPEGPARYHTWFSAKSQQARLEFLRLTGWRNLPSESNTVRQLIEQRARLYVRAGELRRFDRHVYGLLLAYTGVRLRDYRLDPDHPCLTVKEINIIRDFTNILIWTVQREKLRYLKHLRKLALRKGDALGRLDWSRAVRFFEQNKRNIAETFDKTIARFHIYLLESVRHHGHQ
jgi:hypothetical protein